MRVILYLFLCFFSLINISVSADRYQITVTHKGKELGKIVIETMPEVAPKHCHNFDSLVAVKFYDGCAFHRTIPNFMVQGGDPNSKSKPKETWGEGDSTQTNVVAEFNDVSHERGIVSTARAEDPNSGNSQFFICVADVKRLDHKYTVFAKVITGLVVADKISAVEKELNAGGELASPKDKVEMTIKKISKKK
jgi:peptidyl-prolyl cis-trans isomerase B (cyclophilin B)